MRLLFSILVPLLANRKGMLYLSLLCLLLTIAFGIFLLCISGWLLTASAILSSGLYFNLFVPSSLIRFSSIIKVISRYFEKVTGHNTILCLLVDLRTKVFESLMRFSPKELSKYRNGDLVSRLTNDIDMLDTVFLFFLGPLFVMILLSIFIILILIKLLPIFTFIYIFFICITIFFVPYFVIALSKNLGIAHQRFSADIRDSILETIKSHSDIIIFGLFPKKEDDYYNLCKNLSSVKKNHSIIFITANYINNIFSGIFIVCVLIICFRYIDKKYIDFPMFVGILLGFFGLFEITNTIVRGSSRLGMAISSAKRISAITNFSECSLYNDRLLILPSSGNIIFNNVNFTYDECKQSNLILKDINFHLDVGEKIAIVGASGSGKTTLLNLLLGLEEPSDGIISFGGCNINHCVQSEWHKRISFLSQDAPIFMGSIRSNLLIANNLASDEQLWSVLQDVYLDDFVRKLPYGLNTWIGEYGSNLSMGQARRVCLARSLLSESPILLLDEPTANLDHSLEQKIFNNLNNVYRYKERSIILVSHAFIPCNTVEHIYRLKSGLLLKEAS
ncbi:cytochrome bd biosynthesis ABC-type transporter, ATPase and permease [Candidatus Kinetoplastibacterium desouzaii TCC079E]|uniref:Cytochrome bd biosynthesis ABC-type transporter, ATPase and permease n=1 Tax=Candidatus Kinetoplastidibacterium desouzai TCC079E TaxID=1208919 RepID=M1LSW6_9PROT|nr:thiol reductant ABC exporter subunit CydC [Candidatus Kinetoplastibacterium desouzaii]AGF47196.1 cytochrome bd biosynthesis ABC-type transporter, ATPase and permease [Candidatus Kinetoplastibacterium desouzaii TCC079E]